MHTQSVGERTVGASTSDQDVSSKETGIVTEKLMVSMEDPGKVLSLHVDNVYM